MTTRRFALLGPFLPYRGGIAHFSEHLCRALRKRGHEVLPVTFLRQYPTLIFPGKTQLEPASSGTGVGAVRWLDTVNPVTWERVARRIGGYDVVVVQHWNPVLAPVFTFVTRRARARAIVVTHNVGAHEPKPWDAFLVRMLLRGADGCLALSKTVEKGIKALGVGVPVRMAPHPVYTLFGDGPARVDARKALMLDPEAPVLLFFGFIRRYKGLETLLRSMPQIIASMPAVRLVVAGEFLDDAAPYYTLIKELGIGPQVHMEARYIATDEVPKYFCAADVLVQPYESATQSGVAQIAFQYGVPVITTDVGGLPEAVPDRVAGMVVPAQDPKALAEAVGAFFSEGLAESLSGGARHQARTRSWDHLCRELETMT